MEVNLNFQILGSATRCQVLQILIGPCLEWNETIPVVRACACVKVSLDKRSGGIGIRERS